MALALLRKGADIERLDSRFEGLTPGMNFFIL
jgi:hypothetical protein